MELEPLRLPFDLTLRLPGSKSQANRLLIAACLTEGRTVIRDATPADDVVTLVDNLQRLGFRLEWFDREAGVVVVDGGLPACAPAEPVELDCGDAGTVLRFLTAIAALLPGEWILTGTARLRERPIGDLVDALRQLGVDARDAGGRAPVRIRGGGCSGGVARVDASRSSQFVSALMLAGAALEGGLRIECTAAVASPGYIELTRDVLARFGVDIAREGTALIVPGGRLRASGDAVVEGDWSAAGAWLALAEITRSRIAATNLDPQSAQADRLMPLQLELLRADGDLTLDVTETPDQTMNLAVVAALRAGETRFRGATNLRDKECDRLAATVAGLRAVGVDARETEDGMVIRGPSRLRPADLVCHGDHRMAIAFALLGAVAPGLSIDDPTCVSKSYPGFFDDLRSARQSPRCIALIGMRGAGKSTLATAVARELGIEAADTDARIVAQHGDLAALIQRCGWSTFRAIESGAIAEALGPGRVVAIGGGALEVPRNVELIRGRALVVWVREAQDVLLTRLEASARPRLSELPLVDELRVVLARREAIWASIADLQLPERTTVAQRSRAITEFVKAPLSRGSIAATPG